MYIVNEKKANVVYLNGTREVVTARQLQYLIKAKLVKDYRYLN